MAPNCARRRTFYQPESAFWFAIFSRIVVWVRVVLISQSLVADPSCERLERPARFPAGGADPVDEIKDWIIKGLLQVDVTCRRRLAKDVECSIASAEAWIMIGRIRLITRRLARYGYRKTPSSPARRQAGPSPSRQLRKKRHRGAIHIGLRACGGSARKQTLIKPSTASEASHPRVRARTPAVLPCHS